MKLTAQRQQEIHKHAQEVSIDCSTSDEVIDHIMIDLEQKSASESLNMEQIKQSIDIQFNASN